MPDNRIGHKKNQHTQNDRKSQFLDAEWELIHILSVHTLGDRDKIKAVSRNFTYP